MNNNNPPYKPVLPVVEAKPEPKKVEPLKKEAQQPQPKPKYYYDVKVECMLPATLVYKVLAETPQEAAELIKGRQPNQVQHKIIGRKELALKVYDAGSSMMRFMKKLLGG